MNRLRTGVFAALILVATCVSAQWPAKPVALVVGSEPGSAPDVYARAVSGPLTRLLGQSVIVENRTGAKTPN